jgi:hypothetical protein
VASGGGLQHCCWTGSQESWGWCVLCCVGCLAVFYGKVMGLGVGSHGAGCRSIGSGVVMVSDERCYALCTRIQPDICTNLSISDPDL